MTRRIRPADDETVLLDESADPILYVGYAPAGADTSLPIWKIKRIDQTSGADVNWADGDPLYDNIWDNRASLTYSP